MFPQINLFTLLEGVKLLTFLWITYPSSPYFPFLVKDHPEPQLCGPDGGGKSSRTTSDDGDRLFHFLYFDVSMINLSREPNYLIIIS